MKRGRQEHPGYLPKAIFASTLLLSLVLSGCGAAQTTQASPPQPIESSLQHNDPQDKQVVSQDYLPALIYPQATAIGGGDLPIYFRIEQGFKDVDDPRFRGSIKPNDLKNNERIGIFGLCEIEKPDGNKEAGYLTDPNNCAPKSRLKIMDALFDSGNLKYCPRANDQIGWRNDEIPLMEFATCGKWLRVANYIYFDTPEGHVLNTKLLEAIRKQNLSPLVVFQPHDEEIKEIQKGNYTPVLTRLENMLGALQIFPEYAIEVWNEPNGKNNWPPKNWETTYARFAEKVYQTIKDYEKENKIATPTTIVFAALEDPSDSKLKKGDYFSRYYKSLKATTIDFNDHVAFGIHAYYDQGHLVSVVDQVLTQLKTDGFPQKRIWITEFGTQTQKSERIIPLLDQVDTLIKSGEVEKGFIHELGNIPNPDPTQNQFGFIDPSGVPTKDYWLVYWWFLNHMQ